MLLVSPDGKNVYVSAYNDNAITAFARNAENGVLTFVSRVKEGDSYGLCAFPPCPTLDALDGAYGLAISPDGRFIYASSTADHAISVFNRDQTTGGIKLGIFNYPVQVYQNPPELVGAYGITLSPDGTQLYATGYASNTLLVFNRNGVNGTVSFVEAYSKAQIAGLEGVFRVTTSSDGAYVYTASYDTDSVTAFKRNPASGKLTHIATYTNGLAGVDGIDATTDLVSAGTASVAVTNPAPSGGISNTLMFTITAPDNNPVPSVTTIAPQGAVAGSPALVLTISGVNFIASSQVQWNGANRATTFVSATTLQAQITLADLAQPGQADVTIINPAPGGSTSNAATFSIAGPGQNPPPTITQLTPASANLGSAGSEWTLVIIGMNFVDAAQGQWNGVARPTTFISANEVRLGLSAADLLVPGTASVVVKNPAPGGGPSNVVTFTIGTAGSNQVPVLTRATLDKTRSDITVTLTGAGFIAGAME